jgi:putative nucleotidyltransferase with HDIG domain
VKRRSDTIQRLFPEVDLIENSALRKKVAVVWQEAMRLGGWRMRDLKSIPFTLVIPGCKIDLILHTRAVTQTSVKIAQTLLENYGKAIRIDLDVLVAGALLHDVGKLLEYTKKAKTVGKSRKGELLRHPFSGQALAYKHGLPYEVLHTIAYHSKEGDLGKRTVESIIIHHADFVNFEPLKK